MKIVFLAPFGIRPKGTVIARMVPLAAELQSLGNQVIIIAPPYTNPEDSGKEEMVRGVRLLNVRLPAGGKFLVAPILAWRLFRAALDEHPDLVHLFKPKGYGGVAAMLMIALRRLGFRLPPVVIDTDDWEGKGGMNDIQKYSRAEKAVFAFQERWLLPHALGVTVASRVLEKIVAEMGVPVTRIMYLPNCVEEPLPGDGTIIRDRYDIPLEARVVLLYTRFFEFSQEKLYAVFAEIHRQVPTARFLVVGKGRSGEEGMLALAAAQYGFESVLHVAGWVDPVELPDYFAAGDLAIYPFDDTLVNRCKCPAKLTELLSAGVPVVADRVGQIPEYIRSRDTGVLCEPDNWQEMADAATALLQDSAQRQATGAESRRFVLEQFSWRSYAALLYDYYHRSV